MRAFIHRPAPKQTADLVRSTKSESVAPYNKRDAAREAPRTASPHGFDFSRIPLHHTTGERLQTKLTVNIPGDVYEQEADRVADAVMRMPESHGQAEAALDRASALAASLQTSATPAGGSGGFPAPPMVHEVLRSPGQPLDAGTRAFMEPRFGQDFSDVRVHTDGEAAESAAAIDARAFTANRSIAFGAGQYAPWMEAGRRLLAHELAHVVQQQTSTLLTAQVGSADGPDEATADEAANQVVSAVSTPTVQHEAANQIVSTVSAPAVQRQSAGQRPPKSGTAKGSQGTYKWDPDVISPGPIPMPGPIMTGSHGEAIPSVTITGTKTLSGLAQEINKIGADVDAGVFVDAALSITIPVPDVPGLSIACKFSGKYFMLAGGNKELEVKETIGVDWKFFGIFSVGADYFVYLNLAGENLGAAFVDALTQIAHRILVINGIDKEFKNLANWKNLPRMEKLKDLGEDIQRHPILFPHIQVAKLISSEVETKTLQDAYAAYRKFFENNPDVGFEAGFGVAVRGKAELSPDLKEELSFESVSGVEDVDKRDAREFAEISVVGTFKIPGSELEVKVSKRWRADGSQQVELSLEGSIRGDLAFSNEILAGLKAFLKSTVVTATLGAAALSTKDDKDKSINLMALAKTAAFIPILIPIKASEKKIGLDLTIKNNIGGGKSTWEAKARIKEFQEFGNTMKSPAISELKTELKYGTFIDLSGSVETFLNQTYPAGLREKKRIGGGGGRW